MLTKVSERKTANNYFALSKKYKMAKKYVTATTLLIVLSCILIAFFVGNFIQPILPPTVNSSLIIFVAAATGVVGIFAALNDIFELKDKIFGSRRDTHQPTLDENSLNMYPYWDS